MTGPAFISFAVPSLAVAAVAAGAIPIIIHLLHRRRPRRVPWAAMHFLVAANRRSFRRARLEQWLLLAVRTLVVVLLGLAAAGPFLTGSTAVAIPSRGTLRVILLDNSCSMRARSKPADPGGAGEASSGTRFNRAVQYTSHLLESLAPADAVCLIVLAGPPADRVIPPIRDRRAAITRLNAITATQASADLVGGMDLALDTIRDSEWSVADGAGSTGTASAVVYVVSDQAVTQWTDEPQPGVSTAGSASSAVAAARRVSDVCPLVLVTIEASPATTAANVGIVSFQPAGSLVVQGLPARLEVAIANYSDTRATGWFVRLEDADRVIRRVAVPALDPGQEDVLRFTTVFDELATRGLTARLIPPPDVVDSLPDDNARYLSLAVTDAMPVLLVDGRFGAPGLTGAAGFLSMALAPQTDEETRFAIEPTTIGAYELTGEVLTDYDVIALCDVARLPDDGWPRLHAYVSGGGGLLVFMGDAVEREHYNRYAGGNPDLLPVRLGEIVSFERDADNGVRFRHEPFQHPMLLAFAVAADSGLFRARIDRYVQCEPDPTRTTVLMHYDTGDPAIVVHPCGAGQCGLVTTSADMAWNILPAKGDYVSLMVKLFAQVARQRGSVRNVRVGDDLVEPIPTIVAADLSGVRVTTPDGESRAAVVDAIRVDRRAVGAATPVAAEFAQADMAGLYRMNLAGDVRPFAANIDPRESDLAIASKRQLTGWLDCPFEYVVADDTRHASPPEAVGADLSMVTLAFVLLLVIGETLLSTLFGTRNG